MDIRCPEPILEDAFSVLQTKKVAVFIVAYGAEKLIGKVLARIPPEIAKKLTEVYIIDDSSKDNTVGAAAQAEWPTGNAPLRIYRTPTNQGYGGNQRLGYQYAIERGFDIVVLLHGDGQYAPEALPWILAPYAHEAKIVFGSRMIRKKDALKGGMPVYKWFGNQVLTKIQNTILGMKLSEMHSGYRSYSTEFLKRIPFSKNSLGFDFDADIIVQAQASKTKIIEVPIPTFYGEEVCHVNGMDYAWKCFKTAIKYRLMSFEIFYDPKFDLKNSGEIIPHSYLAETSIAHFIRELPWIRGMKVLDVSMKDGRLTALPLAEKGLQVTGFLESMKDAQTSDPHPNLRLYPLSNFRDGEANLPSKSFDVAVSVQSLEHFDSSEKAVQTLFKALKPNGMLYVSAGNIAFFLIRLLLIFGEFNYARRGLLDFGHRRLFTVKSLKRLLRDQGFRVERIVGFGPPIADLWLARHQKPPTWASFLDRCFHRLAMRFPKFFSFTILAMATRLESAEDLLAHTRSLERPRETMESATPVH